MYVGPMPVEECDCADLKCEQQKGVHKTRLIGLNDQHRVVVPEK